MPDVLVVPRILRDGSGPTAEFIVLSQWCDRPNHRFRTRPLAEQYVKWKDERGKARWRDYALRIWRLLPWR